MFTGLIQAVGTVAETVRRGGSTRVGIAPPLPLVRRMQRGESVCVDGVCLTVTSCKGRVFYADVVAETLSRTTLQWARRGQRVNLERALRVGDSLGGHWVQGHVDATAPVLAVVRQGDDYRLRLALAPEIGPYVAEKGSITLQGVALTVAKLGSDDFEIALVPETLARTTLGQARSGDRLNVEVDLMARYLERLVQGRGIARRATAAVRGRRAPARKKVGRR